MVGLEKQLPYKAYGSSGITGGPLTPGDPMSDNPPNGLDTTVYVTVESSESDMTEINIEVNGALFTVKNKSNLRLQLTVLTKLSCRWITHNYVLHSMSADFELGVADFGVALAAATAASSGHWMDQILKTHCSLLIYESIFEETTHCNPYSPLLVAVMVQVEATHQLATQLEVKSILNRLDRGRNSSLSEMQVETELSPGECIGWITFWGLLSHLASFQSRSMMKKLASRNLAQKLRKGIFTIQQAAAAQIHQQHNGITIGQKIIICFRFTCVWLSGYWAFSTSVASTVRSMLDLNGFQWRRTTKLASFMIRKKKQSADAKHILLSSTRTLLIFFSYYANDVGDSASFNAGVMTDIKRIPSIGESFGNLSDVSELDPSVFLEDVEANGMNVLDIERCWRTLRNVGFVNDSASFNAGVMTDIKRIHSIGESFGNLSDVSELDPSVFLEDVEANGMNVLDIERYSSIQQNVLDVLVEEFEGGRVYRGIGSSNPGVNVNVESLMTNVNRGAGPSNPVLNVVPNPGYGSTFDSPYVSWLEDHYHLLVTNNIELHNRVE
ncbi:hypothetical protein Tco_1079850 [Tanacetum coccineum]|uniref:Uncharacterized protein n=1 Tax=Tanacetum coccineum TaxID=301880 RepID=A0ABQ5HUG9_9ASTR